MLITKVGKEEGGRTEDRCQKAEYGKEIRIEEIEMRKGERE